WIEIKKTGGDFETTERKRRFHIVESNQSLQSWMQPRATQFQIAHGPAVGQVTANEHRVLRLNRDIKFPIADRRLREGKIRARRRRVRRRAARATAWELSDNLYGTAV